LSESPIGVFDSGVGGLTVLKALAAELPHEHFVYLGDTARLPYGTKSPETVARYAVQAAEALLEYGVKCLVIACNTASSVGLRAIREHIEDIPVVGVIEPGAEAACAASKSGHIAVIATEGTVRGGAYQEAIRRLRTGARIVALPTQLFVALAEEGLHEGQIAENVARHYLWPIFQNGRIDTSVRRHRVADVIPSRGACDVRPAYAVPPADAVRPAYAVPPADHVVNERPDTLVLGCTHFPMLAGAIRTAVGPDIRIVDSAATTARSVREMLDRQHLTRQEGEGTTRFLATDSVERFARIGSHFLARPIGLAEVELIDL
jgi:glutamate racemase